MDYLWVKPLAIPKTFYPLTPYTMGYRNSVWQSYHREQESNYRQALGNAKTPQEQASLAQAVATHQLQARKFER